MNRNFLWTAMLAALMMGCGGSSEESESVDDQDQVEIVDDASEPEDVADEFEKYTPVDYKQLKDLLPATTAGMKLKQAIGSSESGTSEAMGNYENEKGDKTVLITITDKADNERESEERDFEVSTDKVLTTAKNTKIKGFPAYETYSKEAGGNGNGTLRIIANNRFKVGIMAVNMSLDDMRNVAKNLDLDKLAAMK